MLNVTSNAGFRLTSIRGSRLMSRPLLRRSSSGNGNGEKYTFSDSQGNLSNGQSSPVVTALAEPEGGAAGAPASPAQVAPAIVQESYAGKIAKLLVGMSVFVASDQALKSAFASLGWSFPAPLAGMFIIISILGVVSKVGGDQAVDKINDAFKPALDWVAKWLPLFYVPSLITLPLYLGGIPGGDMLKIVIIIAGGMVASLLFTAQAAVVIRKAASTKLQPAPPGKAPEAYTKEHVYAWTAALVASLAAAVLAPAYLYEASLGFMLASTVLGLLIGSSFPSKVKSVLHPVLVTAVSAQLGALVLAAATNDTAVHILKAYLTKGAVWGAGDLLMSFLGTVILSFGFRVFAQRDLMQRHAAEIFGACFSSAFFGLFATALAAKAIGLPGDLVKALVPRSVTIALALPIAAQLETTQPAVTAAAVVLTGLLGANFVQALLNRFGYADPIARGLATAAAAHGLGTAALAAKEPDALPFCALAYALIGIMSTLLVCIPQVRLALIAIAGV